MDEIGYQLSYYQKEKVVFDRRIGPPQAVTTGNTNWVTSIECISADGYALSPLIIHQGLVPREPMDRWFPPSKDYLN